MICLSFADLATDVTWASQIGSQGDINFLVVAIIWTSLLLVCNQLGMWKVHRDGAFAPNSLSAPHGNLPGVMRTLVYVLALVDSELAYILLNRTHWPLETVSLRIAKSNVVPFSAMRTHLTYTNDTFAHTCCRAQRQLKILRQATHIYNTGQIVLQTSYICSRGAMIGATLLCTSISAFSVVLRVALEKRQIAAEAFVASSSSGGSYGSAYNRLPSAPK